MCLNESGELGYICGRVIIVNRRLEVNRMIFNPKIKVQQQICDEDYKLIDQLQQICTANDGCNLKLELDYKLASGKQHNQSDTTLNNESVNKNSSKKEMLDKNISKKEILNKNTSTKDTSNKEMNEFMYFEDEQLIGYLGICCFGGPKGPLELNGMVHPDYRRQGVFRELYQLAMDEIQKRKSGGVLLLCDRLSDTGLQFIKVMNGVLKHSEYEMYLMENSTNQQNTIQSKLHFRKASNEDALEIARQDSIYFGEENDLGLENDLRLDNDLGLEKELDEEFNQTNIDPTILTLPEEEEEKGFTIFLAELEGKIIGKINLQLNDTLGGIYGVGVLPEYRNKGYGRAILNFGITQLKEWKASEIMLQVVVDNLNALGLYQSCGFEVRSTMDYYGI